MSLLTSAPWRAECLVCRSSALFRMLLSGLLPGISPGSTASVGRVWKYSLPVAGLPVLPLPLLLARAPGKDRPFRSEEHTSELQSLMRISYAVFCLKKNITDKKNSDLI